MNKIFSFFKKHSWVLVVIALLVFIPQSFSYQAKLNTRVIVTGLAIDKVEQGYEITAQTILPVNGSEAGGSGAKLGFISETGNSFAEGIKKLSYKIGKTAGLSHVNFLIVGQKMLEDNLALALDYVIRDHRINSSILMLISPNSAKEMIKQTKDLQLSVAVGLQKIFINKQESLNGANLTVEEFLNESYGISKSSLVSQIDIKTEQESEEKSSPSQNGSTSSSKGSGSAGLESEQKGRIEFYNDIYYFKGGRVVNKFSQEQELLGVFFADTVDSNGELKIQNVNSSLLKNATVGLTFRRKETKRRIKFKNGKPVLSLKIKIKDLEINEILNQGEPNINLYNVYSEETINAIEDQIKSQVKKYIVSAYEQAKKDQVDIFNIGQTAYQYHPKKWQRFYEKYGENYLSQTEIEVQTEVQVIS